MNLYDIEIDSKSPFQNDKLNRKDQAEALTKLLSGFENGGVIALNNKWGEGKSTFLKMWKAYLEGEEIGYDAIIFNAWENDYEENPITALFCEIKNKIGPNDKLNTLYKHGGKIIFSVMQLVAERIADKHIGNDIIKDISKIVNNEAEDYFKAEISEYESRKENIIYFKKQLSEYISTASNKKIPLVFIIDELDRCRPDYAVKVLEIIKHIFAVPNMLFVLAIDKEQLEYSINGFYRSEKINSHEYLRRFIDLEYSLPRVRKDDFISFRLKQFELLEYLKDSIGNSTAMLYNLIRGVCNSLSLRQIDKFLIHLNIVVRSKFLNGASLRVILILIYIKLNNTKLYTALKNDSIKSDSLSDQLCEIFNELDVRFEYSILESELILSYTNKVYRDNELRNISSFFNGDNYDMPTGYNSKFNEKKFIRNLERSQRGYEDPDDIDSIINVLELGF